ncbi:MAG: DUF1439 domain-containing protein [Azonexus sp.]
MRLTALAAALACFVTGAACAAGLLEREIAFSEADVQAQIDKNNALQKPLANGLLVIRLSETPRIRLGTPADKATITARLDIALLGQTPIPVDFTGTAGIRYDDERKAFFLADPVADSVQSAALPPPYEAAARQAVSRALASYFRSRPVYVLREDGTLQEKTARWLLRSIRIEPGQVIAVLSPV